MSKPIICPNCGTEITLENEAYAAIVSQVRTTEFHDEVEKRVADERKHLEEAVKLAESNARLDLQKELAEKDSEILALNKKNEALTNKAVIAVRKHEDELNNLKVSTSEEIAQLKEQLRSADDRQKTAVAAAIANEQQNSKDKDIEIARLREQINTTASDAKLEIANISSLKDSEIAELNAKIISINSAHAVKEAAIEDKYREQLKAKDEEVSFYKDFKAKQSTKMIGETLEVHCSTAYATIAPLMPNATFKKDNEVSESGSKGDFIFRDFDDDGNESVSIMFEMKNESEETTHKHRNSDFFKELDKDRNEKKCEYAILVSTLEADSELYNQGIVDVSTEYPKMYVVRPQFFIPIITLLRTVSLKSVEYRKELEELKARDIDVTTFESDLEAFKDSIFKSTDLATKNKDSAIERIDKAITLLQAVKDELAKFDTHMAQAKSKAEKVTVKKLTSKSPSIAEKIAEAHKATVLPLGEKTA